MTFSVAVLTGGDKCQAEVGGFGLADTGGVNLTATDGYRRVLLDKHTVYSGTGGAGPFTWTTPDLPVRVLVDAVVTQHYGQGCSVLFKVTPASAIINGPLPDPPVRTMQIAAPNGPVAGTASQISISGTAYLGDQVGYELKSTEYRPCPARQTPNDFAFGSNITWSPPLLTGAYNQPFPLTLPKTPGTYTVCAWLANTDPKLSTAAANTGITITSSAPSPTPTPTPAPPHPTATITTLSLKRGAKLRANVANATDKLTVTFSRGGNRRKTATVTPRGGQLAVSTRGLARGSYRVGIWDDGALLTASAVRVR